MVSVVAGVKCWESQQAASQAQENWAGRAHMHKSLLFILEKVFSWIPRLAKTGTNPPSLPFTLIMKQSGPHLLKSGEARLCALNIIIEFIWGQWCGFSVIWIPFDFVSSSVETYLLRYKSALHHYNHHWWHDTLMTCFSFNVWLKNLSYQSHSRMEVKAYPYLLLTTYIFSFQTRLLFLSLRSYLIGPVALWLLAHVNVQWQPCM